MNETTSSPLAGRRVVVTRAAHQAGPWTKALTAAGAEVALLPLLELAPPADPRPLRRAASQLDSFSWLVFTSTNAVEAFWRLAAPSAKTRLAAVGPATARALRERGAEPDLVAEQSHGQGLARELGPKVHGQRVLLPAAADARPDLAMGLRAAGAEVVSVVAYEKRRPASAAPTAGALFQQRELGWVTFTSPRIVGHFVALLGEDWAKRRQELQAASIGPVTTAELRRQGAPTVVEAARPTVESLIEAMAGASL